MRDKEWKTKPERRKSRRMINRDGGKRSERRKDKVTNKSPEEINNQHINQNIPYLLNLKKHSLS